MRLKRFRKDAWSAAAPVLRLKMRGPDANSRDLDDDLDDIILTIADYITRNLQDRGYKVEIDCEEVSA